MPSDAGPTGPAGCHHRDRAREPSDQPIATGVLAANLAALDQTISLLQRLSPDDYRRPVASVFNTTIGAHIRHCVDHHQQFLRGLDSGRIDYDARDRDSDVETSLARGLLSVRQVAERVASVDGRRQVLWIRVDQDAREDGWQISSFGRELAFLLSHTVHHQALIAIICRHLGVPVEDELGVAPATLRYRES